MVGAHTEFKTRRRVFFIFATFRLLRRFLRSRQEIPLGELSVSHQQHEQSRRDLQMQFVVFGVAAFSPLAMRPASPGAHRGWSERAPQLRAPPPAMAVGTVGAVLALPAL
jgi:hypothetical protein